MVSLRDGITAEPAPITRGGRRARLLFDPLRHRYFRFDADALRRGGRAVRGRLRDCELLAPDEATASRDLAAVDERRRDTSWRAVMHRYLFVRVPLLRPDRLLDDLLPLARPLMGRAARVVLVVLLALALTLVGRHAGPFLASFAQLATPQGVVATIVSLVVVKSLHELAHALALKARGGRVPTVGVAFVVLFPVLYTDTSDAWRLPRARDRLAVDLAGVRVELAVAVLATLTWIVLPDGGWRLGAFSLAAVSWIMSLFVNLNPFMRFDGYHVLADALDLPNMQERAFALARWRLSEALFAPGDHPPERLSSGLRRTLILYAFATWAYRLIVFTGIAVLVYQATFKALGLVLFAVEIWWFVLRPIAREASAWANIAAARHRRPRTWMPVVLFATGATLLLLPLDRSVTLPATFENGDVEGMHAPEAATLAALHVRDGETVRAGQRLATLAVADHPYRRAALVARMRAAGRAHRMAQLGDDAVDAERRLALVRDELAAHDRSVAALTLRAARSGRIVLPRGTRRGRTFARGALVLSVVGSDRTVIAYAAEGERARLRKGGPATFIADDAFRPAVPLTMTNLADLPLVTLGRPENAMRHGGGVWTDADAKPMRPTFRVRFRPGNATDLPVGRFRGTVHVTVDGRSLGARAVARVWSVLLRESGF